MTDSPSTRMLAGHSPDDPWMLDQLLVQAAEETGATAPTDPPSQQAVAVDWVTTTWRHSHDTRAAIATLARLGETYPDFDLGLFIGLNDEWNGGWGRLEPDLKAAAEQEINHILHGPNGPAGASIRADAGAKVLDETQPPLTLIFHGKIRRLSRRTEQCRSTCWLAAWETDRHPAGGVPSSGLGDCRPCLGPIKVISY